MKTKLYLLLLGLLFLSAQPEAAAQKADEQLITSKIEKVVVYFQGAYIFRETPKQEFKAGRQAVVVKGLSPYLDPNRIKVKAATDITILSVEHRRDFLGEQQYQDTLKNLLEEQKTLQDQLALLQLQDSILDGRRRFLEQNQQVGGSQTGLNLQELEQVFEFYAGRMQAIRTEQLELRKQKAELQKRLKRLQAQAYEYQKELEFIPSDVVITFEAKRPLSSTFELNYLVSNASWIPSYDLRVENIETPVQLIQKAGIYQSTGEDWENVKLLLSNDNPITEAAFQELLPQYLSLQYRQPITYGARPSGPSAGVGAVYGYIYDAETGEPLIFANVLVAGTGIGTVTDYDGSYSLPNLPPGAQELEVSYTGYETQRLSIYQSRMDASLSQGAMLEEVVVTALGGKVSGARQRSKQKMDREQEKVNVQESTILQNQTSFQFELEVPYTILSNGKAYNVNVRNLEIPTEYVYKSVPKVQEKAYLFANLIDWSDYNLLEGRVNLFYEDTYIGESNIDFKYLTDTLQVSLDADEAIQVSHEKKKELRKRQVIGNKRLDRFVYEIQLRNGKKESVQVEVKDQIPVSREKEIEIALEALADGGALEETTGTLSWTVNLAPGESKTLRFEYTVKYPKNQQLYGGY